MLAISSMGTMTAMAAKKKTKTSEVFPFQISIFDPVQIVDADVAIHGFRWNIIYGNNASVSGLDIGFFNKVQGDLSGVAFGAVNCADGNVTGRQIALGNHAGGDAVGVQAGLLNWAEGDVDGYQAGIVNRTQGDIIGIQAGEVNWNEGDFSGGQVGIVNIKSRRCR